MAKLYFIIGCTASGKGSLGRELAKRIGGEIISVDSMKIYRRMDIGTAKPTAQQQAQVPHHCVDIVEPSESFSVAQFIDHADKAYQSIISRNAVALAVGGTSLYIKALSEGLFVGPGSDASIRQQLEVRAQKEGLGVLHSELSRIDPEAVSKIHLNDKKRIIRALEVYQLTGKPISKLQSQWDSGKRRYDCVFIGIRRDKDDQSRRINARVKRMVATGLRDEVVSLLAEPAGLSDQAAQAVGYAEIIEHLRGNGSIEEAVEQIKINTRRLAKKQRTWHRRFHAVHWFDVAEDDIVENIADRVLEEIEFSQENK